MTLRSDRMLERAAILQAAGTPFAMVTVVRCESPTSAKPGAKALVDAEGNIDGWIGGGCAQPAVIEAVGQALKDGQPRLIRITPDADAEVQDGVKPVVMACHSGGTLDIFIDPVIPRPTLLVIGASPAAQSLVALACRTGFTVSAAFPAADKEMFPDALEVFDSLDDEGLRKAAPAFVVVATQGKYDEAGLEAALATTAPCIAFIASERKAGKLRIYLLERGYEPARVEAIIAPAGMDIGAINAEEIALSVLADLVRRMRTDDQYSRACNIEGAESAARPVFAGAGRDAAVDPVCGMQVRISGAEFVSAYRGNSYYFCCAACQHSFDKIPEDYLPREAEKA
ncbi:MAG: XdhC family protein [Gammaproteobacteria bacterium]|nr:XdhC family protein [Gammaproteobacteria bacterium]